MVKHSMFGNKALDAPEIQCTTATQTALIEHFACSQLEFRQELPVVTPNGRDMSGNKSIVGDGYRDLNNR